MPDQTKLFPDPPPRVAPVVRAPAGSTPPASKSAPVWMQRLSLLVLVLFCMYLGIVMAILPWWPAVWDRNLFLTSHVQLWAILRQGWMRGIISGLGVLDIWIGISEAVHYRDER